MKMKNGKNISTFNTNKKEQNHGPLLKIKVYPDEKKVF
jgi:hypothetical protein